MMAFLKSNFLGRAPAPVWVVFVLFALIFSWRLGTVPGLLGDEASEGENVYELLASETWTVMGERSYIGPLIDYIRVPWVAMLGYSPLAIRLPMLLALMVMYWLAWDSLRAMFGPTVGLFALVGMIFSPAFLLYERLGWAVTLFPVFLWGMVWLARRGGIYRWLWVGLTAGLGVANHILFFPTVVGAVVAILASHILRLRWDRSGRGAVMDGALCVTGFMAGFGTQLAVLLLFPEDQGDAGAGAALVFERVVDFVKAFPLYVSGSSYVARYIGVEFPKSLQLIVAAGLLVLSVSALVWKRYRWQTATWLVGLLVHGGVLLLMIDRFTLRYFVMLSVGVWLLAAVGVGAWWERAVRFESLKPWGAVILGVGLVSWAYVGVFSLFIDQGGSVVDFDLGNRTNSAAAFVDHRPLVACLRGVGPVWSENVHIWNRLRYVSHEYADLAVLEEKHKSLALWEVHYRKEDAPGGTSPGDLCPELQHFRVVGR